MATPKRTNSPAAMPPAPNREDALATWNYLEAGIERIMLHLESGIDMHTYMGVYTYSLTRTPTPSTVC
ncbi:hypothetical protein VDGD_21532 [Verticillium dahliae]|uniref:Predicted protein n=1 Tax=Verticillium alfalfae (strain VaMs.102 / ATCC MYA-4576 / FGSC 10136) TaxID=526221 RepID=C9SJ93_VERA1|nr:predicted protein [Verticillium alfalfae VaMs.102]EEY18255.1 predicted protein [Verticillium alfalfae VaMs.102]RBQ69956.1 hypothetical protein VDGD_21532 [Verticillium dahliae]